MILCSSQILDGRADQHCLSAIDIVSRRNGYGRQIDSFEADLAVDGLDEPFHGVFIRAPIVDSVGEEVAVLAEVDGQAVLCQHGPVTVASFHPELSGDARLHRRWLVDAGLFPAGADPVAENSAEVTP
jgi:5'-phosphate synthase pdxT subunit